MFFCKHFDGGGGGFVCVCLFSVILPLGSKQCSSGTVNSYYLNFLPCRSVYRSIWSRLKYPKTTGWIKDGLKAGQNIHFKSICVVFVEILFTAQQQSINQIKQDCFHCGQLFWYLGREAGCCQTFWCWLLCHSSLFSSCTINQTVLFMKYLHITASLCFQSIISSLHVNISGEI